MKVLILGAKGMLGTDLMNSFSDKEVVGLSKDDVDITDAERLKEKISSLSPDIVINAAAYTDVDGCETNKEIAMKVNGESVGYLAKICKEVGAVLIHISTDYVFNGESDEGYKEDSDVGPMSVYGESKLVGETVLKENMDKYYLIRTSWLFGLNGKNFVETIMRLGGEKEELRIVNDQVGSPTFTLDLAHQIRWIIDNKCDFGVYHVTNSEYCSWFEFAKEIIAKTNLNTRVIPVKSDEFPRPAKRPKYSILINTKLSPLRTWKDALTCYLKIKDN